MPIEPVAYLPASREIVLEPSVEPSVRAAAAANFGEWLSQAVQQVNVQLGRADESVQRLAAGQVQNLHEVMITLEQARLGVQLVAQVRNRLLDAYQEVLRMPL